MTCQSELVSDSTLFCYNLKRVQIDKIGAIYKSLLSNS
jgi:hypothetical protein